MFLGIFYQIINRYMMNLEHIFQGNLAREFEINLEKKTSFMNKQSSLHLGLTLQESEK